MHHRAFTTRRTIPAGTVVACLVPAAIIASSPSTPWSHPDAELLALGWELKSLDAAFRQAGTDAASYALCDRYAAVQERIAALTPKTAAGLAVRLRLAWEFRTEFNDRERCHGPQPDSDELTRLLWDLLRDAERLAIPPAA